MKTPFTLFFRNKTNPKFLLKPDTFNLTRHFFIIYEKVADNYILKDI